MDSLTTSYLLSLVLGSAGSFVAAYVGNKMLPIQSSVSPAPVQTPEPTPAPVQQSTEQTQPVAPSITV